MKHIKASLYPSIFIFLMSANILAKIDDATNLCLATIPKSGTHLLGLIVEGINGKKGKWCKKLTAFDQEEMDSCFPTHYYISHAPCVPTNYKLAEENQLKIIALIRDPRDVLVSYAHWVKKGPTNLMYWNVSEFMNLSLHDTMTSMIEHYPCSGDSVPKYTTIAEFYDFYLPWQNYPNAYLTSFEKLIGPQGGGDAQTQLNEIMKIASFLNNPITQDEAHALCSELFGGTRTFREGKVGSWREHIDDEQKKALKLVVGDLLIKLGYEKDYNW